MTVNAKWSTAPNMFVSSRATRLLPHLHMLPRPPNHHSLSTTLLGRQLLHPFCLMVMKRRRSYRKIFANLSLMMLLMTLIRETLKLTRINTLYPKTFINAHLMMLFTVLMKRTLRLIMSEQIKITDHRDRDVREGDRTNLHASRKQYKKSENQRRDERRRKL